MKQIIEELKSGEIRVVDCPMPMCGSNDVLVRNMASLISPGTERLLIEMGKKTILGKALARPDLVALAYQKAKREGFINVFREALDRLDQPLPLGYSSAGEVIEVGREVTGFKPGDRVACAGSNFASHAEIISVPQELCVRIPMRNEPSQPISEEEAAFVMLGGIALQGIRSAQLTLGENVVVVGLGLVGLLTVQIARAYGCRAVGVDISGEKLRLAKQLGCDFTFQHGVDDIEALVQNVTDGNGADAVILTAATDDNSPILLAERVSRKRGRIVLVGVSDLSLTRKAFWDKELTFTVSKASGPSSDERGNFVPMPIDLVRWTEHRNLEEFIRLVANGSVDVKPLVTHRFPVEKALAAYEMVTGRTASYVGVLITYLAQPSRERLVRFKVTDKESAATTPGTTRKSVGVIGAGAFTKNILLPVARKIDGLTFVGIAARSGVSSRHVGETFGFSYASTDHNSLLKDDRIGSVIITTRHDSHAKMVIDALQAGKNVFVEKPLCITQDELDNLISVYGSITSPVTFMVGFNRRYAPLSVELENRLRSRITPLQIIYRVNAGYIPPDHWTQDARVGGGRIIGEVCHMVDYLQFLTGSQPIDVYATSIGGNCGKYLPDDNVSISIRFLDGSLGTILYSALGSKAFSRERIEIYGGDTVSVLDDFRTLETIRGTRRKRMRLWNQDLGYRNELIHFFSGNIQTSREQFVNAVLTTRATMAAVESLKSGKVVPIDKVYLWQ